ncbi:MAG: TRAP transporter large permease subunit, partial [Hyphomicrobiaceae bacterium]
MSKEQDVSPSELEIADELIAERKSGAPGDLPQDMAPWMRRVITIIDTISLWAGHIICWMLVPLMFAMVYEVFMRKVFIAPTDWAYDVSRMLCGAMFMLGAGYALMRGVHIRADFIYRNWSPQTQGLIDATLYLVFYFPAMLFFFWISLEYATSAWFRWERSMDTAWMAPVAPVRSAMPIGAFLLITQGISEVLKCVYEFSPGLRRSFLRIIPIYLLILAVAFVTVMFPDFMPIPFADWMAEVTTAVGGDAISSEMIGAIMIAVMLFAIFVGFPISFTLIFLGIFFGSIGFGSKLVFYLMTLQFNNVMLEQTLAAVPLFVFMGILMEQAGLMERLFRSVQLMLASTRGSLYVAVLFVSTIFAAATGIVGASVTILGIMAAKTMNRSGYDVRLASGTITAGGTLGILIPPSIMLVVMGPVLEVPVTDLFAAAILPGIMLAFLYTAYALIRCWLDPSLGPPLPKEEHPTSYALVAKEFFFGLGPPAAL